MVTYHAREQTPLGSWPEDPKSKEIGGYSQLVTEQDLEGFVLFVANTIGWSKEEVAVYVSHFRREVRNPKHHGYYRQKVVIGRKPK
jgi:hypothetical protein